MDRERESKMEAEDGQWEEEMELRRGPWTVEEDVLLADYIATHGEGRWNSLARSAGLKRTGKSCRLRWLNYLRPDLRRGSITPEEQLLILELHSRWGNRWSRIAQHLPGRTDNEIKNYWRTRVQKHAKQLKCDVNSKQFKDAMKYLWMPRLMERIRAAADVKGAAVAGVAACQPPENSGPERTTSDDLSAVTGWSSPPSSEVAADCNYLAMGGGKGEDFVEEIVGGAEFFSETLTSPVGGFNLGFPDVDHISLLTTGEDYFLTEDLWSTWSSDNYSFLQ